MSCSFCTVSTYKVKNSNFSGTNKMYAFIINYGTFACTHISLVSSSCSILLFLHTRFCFCKRFSKKPNTAWCWTTTGSCRVAMALSFISFCMPLTFLIVCTLAVFLIFLLFIIFLLLFIENGREYGRVLWMDVTSSMQKFSLWYAVEDCGAIFVEFVLFLYLYNTAMHIMI